MADAYIVGAVRTLAQFILSISARLSSMSWSIVPAFLSTRLMM
jgi:hypothetical protein